MSNYNVAGPPFTTIVTPPLLCEPKPVRIASIYRRGFVHSAGSFFPGVRTPGQSVLEILPQSDTYIGEEVDRVNSLNKKEESPRSATLKTPVAGALGMSLGNGSVYSSGEMKSVYCDSPIINNQLLSNTDLRNLHEVSPADRKIQGL